MVELLEAFGNDAESRKFKLSFGQLILAGKLGNCDSETLNRFPLRIRKE